MGAPIGEKPFREISEWVAAVGRCQVAVPRLVDVSELYLSVDASAVAVGMVILWRGPDDLAAALGASVAVQGAPASVDEDFSKNRVTGTSLGTDSETNVARPAPEYGVDGVSDRWQRKTLLSVKNWLAKNAIPMFHCSGVCNPAEGPSRGTVIGGRSGPDGVAMFRPERTVRCDRKRSELSSDSESKELKVRAVRRGRGPEQRPPAESRDCPSLDSLYRAAADLD